MQQNMVGMNFWIRQTNLVTLSLSPYGKWKKERHDNAKRLMTLLSIWMVALAAVGNY
jgi:hypothetical protein